MWLTCVKLKLFIFKVDFEEKIRGAREMILEVRDVS